MESSILKAYGAEKHISSDFGSELNSLDDNSRSKIEEIIVNLNPSVNSLKGIYVLASEICKRDKVDLGSFLNSSEFKEIYKDPRISRKDKLVKVKILLDRLRFPEKFELIDSANNLVDQIRKKYSLKLNLPDELEGDNVNVSFNLRSVQDLKQKIEDLEKLKNSGDLENVFNLLLGR